MSEQDNGHLSNSAQSFMVIRSLHGVLIFYSA